MAEETFYDNTGQAMETFRETAVAFDDIIVQVGRAIAAAQEKMDLNQVDFQRQVMKALKEGKIRRLDVLPVNAYSMPETTLYLKIGLSITQSEQGTEPVLSAVPLNATTTNQSDIDIESATEIRLRFVSVPQSAELPGPSPGALAADQVQEIVETDPRIAPLLEELSKCTIDIEYKAESRLWLIAYLDALEARMVVLVDDRTSEVTAVIDKNVPPTEAELAPIQAPVYHTVEPPAGKQGDILTLHGDNFLTLAGQTTLSVDDRPIPMVRLSMKTISFKVPGWATRGDIKVTTPLGTAGKDSAFTPIPVMSGFEPRRGSFDALRQQGTWLSIYGHNLQQGCTIAFATGAQCKQVQVLSPGQMKVEVPENAGTGPLTLLFGDFRQGLEQMFFMLPKVDRVTPRQARVGEEVTLFGNSMGIVTQLIVGEAVVPRQDFTLHTPTQIRFLVPPGASDGHIRLREILADGQYIEVAAWDIFYVVPRITGFGTTAALPDTLLTIYGEGLDPNPDMMSLLFEAHGGISEAPVLTVSPDRTHLTTRVPSDAVTGYVLLLRKTVYTHSSPTDTSDLSRNKLTVLTPNGALSDLVLEERFESETLSCWTPEAGEWQIDRGMLAAGAGPGRLALNDPPGPHHEKQFPLEQLSFYADLLGAERFGISLTPAGGTTLLQLWINLVSDTPALTWNRIDTKGKQTTLQQVPLGLLPGKNYLAQLNIKKWQTEEKQGLELTFLIDREPVDTFYWEILKVGSPALLSDSAAQHWDNVVVLKGDYLSLQEPDLYRFGELPELPELPSVGVDSFEPVKGVPGTEVVISGKGFDGAARFFFGGAEAAVIEAAGDRAVVEVPPGACTGPIEIRGRGGFIVTTGEQRFLVAPVITGLVPEKVLAGQQLHIIGTNLPFLSDTFSVRVLDQPASVTAASQSMVTVLVPDIAGKGKVFLSYEGFEKEAPSLLEVNRETLLVDMVETAANGVWTCGAAEVPFGALGEQTTDPSVQLRNKERLEDDRVYGPVLYVHPPAPDLRALQGVFPELTVPQQGRLELRLVFGMLWSAAPAAEEAAEVDGVMFEVTFKSTHTGEEIPLLSRITCVHDNALERFIIDAAPIAGKKGQLVLSIFAGRTGLRDDAAVVTGRLVHLS